MQPIFYAFHSCDSNTFGIIPYTRYNHWKKATVAKNTISNGAVRENWMETKYSTNIMYPIITKPLRSRVER